MKSRQRFPHTRRARAQRDPRVLKALPWALALCFGAPLGAQINPTTPDLPMGGTVANGNISSALTADRLTITQSSNRAILDWQSFNIGGGKTVEFVQPGAHAAVLNRVNAAVGQSEIHGRLQANGMVLIMNPNGVLFGQGSVINVGSLIATTGTVDPSRFMDELNAGFIAISGATGMVRNRGQISAAGAGLVALVAPSVRNDGQIMATGGRIVLAGSDRATVSLNGGLFEFALPAGAAGNDVANVAGARLEGAQLLLSTGDAAGLLTGTINLAGVQQASSAIVVDGGTVELRTALEAPTLSGSARRIEVSPNARVADAVKIARTGSVGDGATVALMAGEHTQPVVLDKAHLTLQGEEGARLIVSDLAEVNGISIRAHHVTVENLEIAGPINQPYANYYATPRPNISRGIAVADGVTGFTIRNNDLHDLRTGILVHGRNSTGSITGNRIENTKSGLSVQYTDGNGIAIAGNTQGPVGNEWGVNLHLNGHLDGSGNILSNSTPIATAPSLAWQQALLDLSTANNGWSVQDQGYTRANRTQVQVAGSGTAGNQGSVLTPISTVQDGINAVVSGGTVHLTSGSYTQTSTLNVDKPLTLAGAGEATTTVDASGLTSGYGMLVTADNVTLRDFTFYGPSAFYASAYGIKVSPSGNADARLRNFSVMNVTSRGAGKAELDLNGVDGALIDHVTLDGAPVAGGAGSSAGAGLQLTDSANITVRNSTTRNNTWGGAALYQANRSYNQRTNNIRIEGNNQFQELNPVYLQDESALHDFGSLDIAGLGYAVRNNANVGSMQYTWLQSTRQNAYDWAVNLPAYSSSTIQGWSGTGLTQRYEVGVGNLQAGGSQAMSIAAAIARADSGATVHLGAGAYSENLVISRALTLEGEGQGVTRLRSAVAGGGDAVTVNNASNVTLSNLAIEQYAYGLRLNGVAHDVTVERVAFQDNIYGVRNGTATRADNFRLLNSSISGGQIGVQTYNGYTLVNGVPEATGSFANALFENVTIDGPTFKGLYLETANNLTLRNVTVSNAGNYGAPSTSSQHQKYGAAIDINLKYDAYDSLSFDNVTVLNSGASSGDASRAAVVIKTRGVAGDASYAAAPASLQSVNINGGRIEGSSGTGLRVETLSDGAGGQPTVTISGTQFASNGQDLVVDNTRVDARGAVFVGAADGFAIEDRVTHALDGAGRGLVRWEDGKVYVTQASGSVQRGLDAADTGDTVAVADGSYAEQVQMQRRQTLQLGTVTLQGLNLAATAAGSGISGQLTVDGAAGITFDADVQLLGDTRLATTGSDIRLRGDVQNGGGAARDLRLVAGSGGSRGNVTMRSGGTQGDPLRRFEVQADRYALSDTLWVQSYQIDALGTVALSAHTLRALDANASSTLNAGGDVTGSTITLGSVVMQSAGDVTATINAGGNASVAAQNITGSIAGAAVDVVAQGQAQVDVVATQSVTLSAATVAGSVSAPVAAVESGGSVQLALQTQTATVRAEGGVSLSGTSSNLNLDAPSGNVSGSFGQVSNAGDGVITVNGRAELNAGLTDTTESNRIMPGRNPRTETMPGTGPVERSPSQAPVFLASGLQVTRSSTAGAAALLNQGQSVEIDLAPGNTREQP
ncbi:MAG: filamentous hemagglutinin N-terminal domain-containing protein [Hylemonella sp.]|uniref:two-partner secretion domain-containing protein n=1 Tax=Hylemonella sp. TaxID=2066020 RepID=UPI0022BC67C5|nr:filamentous hemagglutinin N-terminal domain-containing protein [Hylemonella sp.]MCZ8251383.1 filamentous hemagglutinin N-terminal domain-containing protein [Hylemonella sp.]